MAPHSAPALVLTVAGLDPTAGAGILADIKTFAANQVYGLACVSAMTVQNTHGAHSYVAVDAEMLEQQLESLLSDLQPRAVKLGMLGSAATVEVVARQLQRHPAPWVVLDPVWKATSGAALMDAAGWQALRERLLPLVSVVTPNVYEACELARQAASTQMADLEQAAIAIRELGPRYVVITGGHLDRPTDLLYDGEKFVTMAGDRVRTPNTHGTGCTFSAALAANLANGKQMQDAVVLAKAYLTAALKQAYAIGGGPGPLNHLYRLQEAPVSRNVEPAPQMTHTTR